MDPETLQKKHERRQERIEYARLFRAIVDNADTLLVVGDATCRVGRRLIERGMQQARENPWASQTPYQRTQFLRPPTGRPRPTAQPRPSSSARDGRGLRGSDVHTEVLLTPEQARNGTVKQVIFNDPMSSWTKSVTVRFHPGLLDMTQLRLAGKGMPGVRGAPCGDAFLTVFIVSS